MLWVAIRSRFIDELLSTTLAQREIKTIVNLGAAWTPVAVEAARRFAVDGG